MKLDWQAAPAYPSTRYCGQRNDDRHPHYERQLVPGRIFLRRHLYRLPEINVSLISQLSNQVQWGIVVRVRTLAVRSGRTVIALGSSKFLLKLGRLHFSLPASGKTMYLDTVMRNAFQGLALKVLETAMTFEAALVLLISSAVCPLKMRRPYRLGRFL